MLKIENGLPWISSLGGPLILMERHTLTDWKGDSGHENAHHQNFVSDYDRAGEIEDYVGLLDVGEYTALVLSMPDHTSYVSINSGMFLLVRWIGADSEEQILNTLRKLNLDQPWIDTNVRIRFRSSELVLFDSVYAGNEVTDSLIMNISPGNYRVSILSYQPNIQTDLLLILIAKIV